MYYTYVYVDIVVSNIGGTNLLYKQTKSQLGVCVCAVLMWMGDKGLGYVVLVMKLGCMQVVCHAMWTICIW